MSSECPAGFAGGKESNMSGSALPFSLIASFLLAILALLVNQVAPGVAALVAAVAALIFIKLLIFGS
jgi:hypothetical protein